MRVRTTGLFIIALLIAGGTFSVYEYSEYRKEQFIPESKPEFSKRLDQ